jgi:transposase
MMEVGVSYNKKKLHKVGYFRGLLKINKDIDESLRPLLQLCRETLVRLQKTEGALVRSLERDPLLAERVNRHMTIPAVGPITALTWALEVGDVSRFSSIKKRSAIVDCAEPRRVRQTTSSGDRYPSSATSICSAC